MKSSDLKKRLKRDKERDRNRTNRTEKIYIYIIFLR